MHTKIYTTRKLERLIKKRMGTDANVDGGKLGKWNATVFYKDKKKCWLFTNGPTRYNVILTDIRAADVARIDTLFKEAFYGQLIYDGILVDYETVESMVGQLVFLPTDNDRSMTGFQNQRLYDMEFWKYEFETLEDMPINDLTNRMNGCLIHIGSGKKMSDLTTSIREMKKLLLG